MKNKPTIEEHRQGLIDLYMNQLKYRNDTVFMKSVLKEAVRRLYTKDSSPNKIENWVVKSEKKSRSLTEFTV